MPLKKGKPVLVREDEAGASVRPVFDEIKESLGVPHVNVLYQAYAAHPQFLELHWKAVKPIVETQEFFKLAERLHAEAYTRVHNYFAIPDLCERMTDLSFSAGARNELTYVVDLFNYNNPLLLLLVAAQMQAFDSAIGRHDQPHPATHPVAMQKPVLVEEEKAPSPTKKIFEDIKRTLGVPLLNTDYRAMARWPDFLRDYWALLKGIVQSPLYKEHCQAIRASALVLANELPQPFELTVAQLQDAGVSDDDVESAVRLTELFVKILSGLVLNLAVAKIGLEGGNSAARTAA
ncbi:MAG: halocarboxylic acid dehydrogenase DehI family protein [Acidobacteriales bacterium]|nr:halocarboxylic acid dehydrogenase DehI family protein [Terriglobales bacterium]